MSFMKPYPIHGLTMVKVIRRVITYRFSFGDAVALGLLLEPPLLSGYKASVANLRRQVGFPFFLSCVLKERNTHFMLVLSEPHRKQITLQTT